MISDQEKMEENLIQGMNFTNQLQSLLQSTTKHEEMVGSAKDLTSKLLQSFTNALSLLNSGESEEVCQTQFTAGSPSSDDRKSEESGESRKTLGSRCRKVAGGYSKRRKTSNTRVELTPTPIDDGRAWRKYGQKDILNAKFPRSYFRCTHKHDQNCQATKHVQKTEDDPPMYQTTYMGEHTCKDTLKAPQIVLELSRNNNDSCIISFNSDLTTNQEFAFPSPSFDSVRREFREDSPSDDLILNQQDSMLLSEFGYFTDLLASGPTEANSILLDSTFGSGDHFGDYSCATSDGSFAEDGPFLFGCINHQ